MEQPLTPSSTDPLRHDGKANHHHIVICLALPCFTCLFILLAPARITLHYKCKTSKTVLKKKLQGQSIFTDFEWDKNSAYKRVVNQKKFREINFKITYLNDDLISLS